MRVSPVLNYKPCPRSIDVVPKTDSRSFTGRFPCFHFEPTKVFEGTARSGVAAFPANVNVAAALGLAGIGLDQTMLEIWADPSIDRNTHSIQVEADSSRMELKIENVPSKENPRTGRIVALSIIAALRRLVDPLTVGS